MGASVTFAAVKNATAAYCRKIGGFGQKMADFCRLRQSCDWSAKSAAKWPPKNGGFLPFCASAPVAPVTPVRGDWHTTGAGGEMPGKFSGAMRDGETMINFTSLPPVGHSIDAGGQGYFLADVETREGKSPLLVWVSRCADCGDEFQLKTLLTERYPSRRCPAHKSPGRVARP